MRRGKKLTALLAAGLLLTTQAMPVAESAVTTASAADDTQDDWLHVEGDKIVDMSGNEVWLTGVNWFGFNVGSQVFDGVWSVSMHDCLRLIADHGFNLLRVPMSVEILLQWKNGDPDPSTPKVNFTTNPELIAEFDENGTPVKYMYSRDIWDTAVKWCKELGIKIMVDIHSAPTHASGHQFPLWYAEGFTDADWIESLEWLAETYKNDDTIVAIDLKNEPHGKADEPNFAKWDDSKDPNNWKYAAERGAKAVLDINPNLLIMVEGIEVYPKEGETWKSTAKDYARPPYPYETFYGAWWGGNFRGVKDYPIDLGKYQKQLVYSPHDYGPEVYKQTWFYLEDPDKTFTRETLLDDYWRDSWAFIAEDHIAPLLMGEWGGWVDDTHDKTGENRHWLQEIRDYMIDMHIHHTFWCFNENSSDTGGLVYDNFGKWDDVKYEFIKPALWQDDNGVFIGLDHQIPLGANGQTVSQYYGGGPIVTKPTVTTTTQTTTSTTSTTTTISTSSDPIPNPKLKPGDVDCNGDVNVMDAVLLCCMIAESTGVEVSEDGKLNADCDGTHGVSPADVTRLLLVLSGKLEKSELKAAT